MPSGDFLTFLFSDLFFPYNYTQNVLQSMHYTDIFPSFNPDLETWIHLFFGNFFTRSGFTTKVKVGNALFQDDQSLSTSNSTSSHSWISSSDAKLVAEIRNNFWHAQPGFLSLTFAQGSSNSTATWEQPASILTTERDCKPRIFIQTSYLSVMVTEHIQNIVCKI